MESDLIESLVSKDLASILVNIKEFINNEIIPLEHQYRGYNFNRIAPILEEKRQKVKDLGYWCPQISKDYEGMGLSLLEHGLVSEELGRSPWGHYVFNCQAPDSGNMEILIDHGTDEQKEKFLYPLLKGEIRSCFSIVEPQNPGSNPTWISSSARKEGENYIINGHKWFTSSADGAAFAVVMAVTNPEEEKHKRASQILVPTDTPGFRLVRNIPVMGHSGEGWASHAEIKYENCRVPIKNRLGKEGDGFIIAQERLGPGRIHHCMRWIGICERAFDLMCERAVKRDVAPNVSLASQQTIQNWIAENRAEINAARLLTLETAYKIDKKGQYAARTDISLIKFYVANVLQKILDRSIQVHGALGMTDGTPLAFWYAHERGARIYDGPDEVHKRSVSRKILKKYH
ncbi:MAG: (R)-benzylsuccinyl-CoA dehydrogenase [Candidatus Heimdallarchaeota archaeon LC_3]|nr:MAG: (R)-benzylsuccinyl-CoA dehydrogenase [Candidatus Heimdallarchaeota archaeon LC_3]